MEFLAELEVEVPAGTPDAEVKQHEHRSNDRIDVTLHWHPTLPETVCVRDQRHGAHFDIRPQHHRALDVYNHPYAYADFAHVPEKLLAGGAR